MDLLMDWIYSEEPASLVFPLGVEFSFCWWLEFFDAITGNQIP